MKNLDTSTVDKIFIATLVGGERNANRLNFVVFGFFFRTLQTRTGAPTFRQTAGSAQKLKKLRALWCADANSTNAQLPKVAQTHMGKKLAGQVSKVKLELVNSIRNEGPRGM